MKKILIVFFLLYSVGITKNEVFAETLKQGTDNKENMISQNEINQEEIDRRMKIVFDYLNEHASEGSDNQNPLVFDIPVDEDYVVRAEISNQENFATQGKGIGRYQGKIQANTSYTYNLTVNNVVGSGDATTYTVKYRTGNNIGNQAFPITVNSVSITGTPPSGFKKGNVYTSIGSPNGTIIVNTAGSITYTRTLLSNKKLFFSSVSLGSTPNNNLVVDYYYEVN